MVTCLSSFLSSSSFFLSFFLSFFVFNALSFHLKSLFCFKKKKKKGGKKNNHIIHHNKGVDLEISEMKLLVNRMNGFDEGRDQGSSVLGSLSEQVFLDFVRRRGRADLNNIFLCLGINIADLHSSFVVEEDLVSFSD